MDSNNDEGNGNDVVYLTQKEGTNEPKEDPRSCGRQMLERLKTGYPYFFSEETQLDIGVKKKTLNEADVKRALYKRECRKIGVTPIGVYLRSLSNDVLVLRHYNLGSLGTRALSAPLTVDSCLSSIDVSGNAIGAEGWECLTEALWDNKKVTYLNISDNNLGTEGAAVLGRFLGDNTALTCLVAAQNNFKDDDSLHLGEPLQENKSLTSLNLSQNNFENVAGREFGEVLAHNEVLRDLDLSWNLFRKEGAILLARGMNENVGLESLNLAFNGLGSEGCAVLSVGLEGNVHLTRLDLSHNRLQDVDMVILSTYLAKNNTLRSLKLKDNLLTTKGVHLLIDNTFKTGTASKLQCLELGNTGIDMACQDRLLQIQQTHSINVDFGKLLSTGRDKSKCDKNNNSVKKTTPESQVTSSNTDHFLALSPVEEDKEVE